VILGRPAPDAEPPVRARHELLAHVLGRHVELAHPHAGTRRPLVHAAQLPYRERRASRHQERRAHGEWVLLAEQVLVPETLGGQDVTSPGERLDRNVVLAVKLLLVRLQRKARRRRHRGIGQLVPGDEDGPVARFPLLRTLELGLEGVPHAVRRRLDHDVAVGAFRDGLADPEQHLLVAVEERELREMHAVKRHRAPELLAAGRADDAGRGERHPPVGALEVIEPHLVLPLATEPGPKPERQAAHHELLTPKELLGRVVQVRDRHGRRVGLGETGRQVQSRGVGGDAGLAGLQDDHARRLAVGPHRHQRRMHLLLRAVQDQRGDRLLADLLLGGDLQGRRHEGRGVTAHVLAERRELGPAHHEIGLPIRASSAFVASTFGTTRP